MTNNEYLKKCPECADIFEARRLNQKFCSDTCKIRYNNRTLRTHYHDKKKAEIICGKVNEILLKNYRILQQFEGKTVKTSDLLQQGFILRFITEYETDTVKKKNIFFCYDIRYEFFEDKTVAISKR